MVMRQMRENTKWIMLATAIAFVLLMVFQWGMDITGRSSGGLGEIGRVNGTPVMYDQYIATYRNIYDQAQQSQSGEQSQQTQAGAETQQTGEAQSEIVVRATPPQINFQQGQPQIMVQARGRSGVTGQLMLRTWITGHPKILMRGIPDWLPGRPRTTLRPLTGGSKIRVTCG